ncbi:MAG TPA: Stp1/IreP family PP2C-type Ser/Thr phosphatase [Terriglobales bacterium]|jgi:serine/threonine protein phosphatase PrpC|nr:Stp1/IreP family PP2C-type Ser/Thr phosphatase [Terriglobales bacterium]
MSIRPGIEVAGLSDLGCQRENNEDSYSYWEPASDADFAQKGRLAIVADGMGGHEGGQEASRIAVEVIQETYASVAATDPQALLTAGFHEAHLRIQNYAAANSKLRGMGTTATAVVLLANRLYYAHIGDSRLYRVTREEISRLTHDHSYVSRLVESGVITPEEAEAHPQRNILTAALGAGSEVAVETPELPIPLKAGETLVLCTDGLWGQLTDLELQRTVVQNSPATACRALVNLARERGGPDNITVQLLRVM